VSADLSTLRFEMLDETHIPQIMEIEPKVNGSPWSEQAFKNELGHDYGYFRVALLDGKVCGYGGLWILVDEAHITTVAVSQEHQRLGIGWRIMVDLLEAAQERKAIAATLEVRAGNEAALKLYDKLGFDRVAIRPKYYPDNREDAVVMWLYDLEKWEPPTR